MAPSDCLLKEVPGAARDALREVELFNEVRGLTVYGFCLFLEGSFPSAHGVPTEAYVGFIGFRIQG